LEAWVLQNIDYVLRSNRKLLVVVGTYGLADRDKVLANDASHLTGRLRIAFISNLAHQCREQFVLETTNKEELASRMKMIAK